MLIACWSVKGGAGTTVVAAALAVTLGRLGPPVLLADLAGDLPAALGLPDPPAPGLADWLAAGPDLPRESLARLEVDAGPNVRLLPWCGGAHGARDGDGERLAALLAERPVVVADCGTSPAGPALALTAAADRSLLVIRPCYLAVRRAAAAPYRPSAVVLVSEAGRSLGRADIEDVLGVPVVADVPWDGSIARAVDAGLLAGRVPRVLARSLEGVA